MTGGAWSVGQRLTIPWVLDEQAQKRPDQPLLHILDEPVTYAEMRARAVSSANMLAASGIEIAAIGVPSELGEDDVMVCVVVKPGEALEIVPFMDFCQERLPYFAVPRYVEVCAELPKNAVGRVLKHELRARGVTDAAWDRERVGYVVRS